MAAEADTRTGAARAEGRRMQDPRGRRGATTWVRALGLGLLAGLLVSTHAWAIPYFNAPYGFDNGTLQLAPDYAIPTDAVFEPISSGNHTGHLRLKSRDVINDTATGIDRTITWKIVNKAKLDPSDFILFFSALKPTRFDYSDADIDLEGEAQDPMVIASYGPYFFAGFHLTTEDFTRLSKKKSVATRTFRYTVDVPQAKSGPPELGIAYTNAFNVPEPATGLLLVAALAVAAGAGRRRAA